MSNGEQPTRKLPAKQRRVLDPSAVIPVPIYSSKVSSSLRMEPRLTLFTQDDATGGGADSSLWPKFSPRVKPAARVTLSGSEDEEQEEPAAKRASCGPSPPPPDSPVQKQSRRAQREVSELDRKLQAVKSLLSPERSDTRSRRSRRSRRVPSEDKDDVILISASEPLSPPSSAVREIPLKVRCRTDVHKIPVLSSTPLSEVASKLSVLLNVKLPDLLLFRDDKELPTDSTVGEVGLSIADIIECVILSPEDKDDGASGSLITVRLQSKDKNLGQEFSLHREQPLGSVFSQYAAQLPSGAQKKLRFLFDGCKVTERQTPAQLDMEDGDIIEVWT